MKNYSSILAIVNHWNWLDDSPPLRFPFTDAGPAQWLNALIKAVVF